MEVVTSWAQNCGPVKPFEMRSASLVSLLHPMVSELAASITQHLGVFLKF